MSYEYTLQQVPGTDITYETRGSGETAVLFVHGFLQGKITWDDLLDASETGDVEIARLDLAGMGERADAAGPFTLDRFTDDVVKVIDALAKPVVLVGHSIGTQIVELAAARRHNAVHGIVLVAPIPLTGTQFPAENLQPARDAAGDPVALRAVGAGLYDKLAAERSTALVSAAAGMRPSAVRLIGDAFNNGHADGAEVSRFTGPVLLLPGVQDQAAPPAVVDTAIEPRFKNVQRIDVDEASHFPQLEQPAVVARAYDEFLADIRAARRDM
ncbi:alpha/beta fold hydrolase [Streptomyces sp. NPDC090080]|uniref:alpha/beta fold hydrolase n=1 Tax=Streptomyces sp. NPDC090080 TaxID=3365939 RepID=UPI00382F542E